jgi:hypothetical protein
MSAAPEAVVPSTLLALQRRALELGFLVVTLSFALVGALDRRGGLGEDEVAWAAASAIWSSAVFDKLAMVSQAWW